MDVHADYSDNTATSTAIHLHMPDPLMSELCASTRPPTWVDLMLEERTVSRPVGATATQEEEASLVDKLATGSPTLSPVRGQVISLQGE
jgi:hypothetical protein